ncbi:MAG: class I SAM-dependent methyltransferase [Thermoleophilia bacterium]|nr:class I SAM-dependent methyltransferase [Thermoleophilia bacterium]
MAYATPIHVGHRDAVGGMWDEMGQFQLDFLKAEGLKPTDSLLDVGCGSLRAGIHFINYLEPGNYSGIDQEQSLLDAGRDIELGATEFVARRPQLVCMDDFSLGSLGRKFDFAIAQSVFSHLEDNLIRRCLIGVEDALAPGGRFYATFFENENGPRFVGPIDRNGGTFQSFFDRDPFHYTVRQFEQMVEDLDLTLRDIGDWGHPREQRMLCFERTPG